MTNGKLLDADELFDQLIKLEVEIPTRYKPKECEAQYKIIWEILNMVKSMEGVTTNETD